MSSYADKRAAFKQNLKINTSNNPKSNAAKKTQVLSNNANGSNKASAPSRGRSLGGGRGNER